MCVVETNDREEREEVKRGASDRETRKAVGRSRVGRIAVAPRTRVKDIGRILVRGRDIA